MKPFKFFSDGASLAFGTGRFDDFCIYFTRPDGTVWFPLDTEYFTTLARFADRFGGYKVYDDFLRVYTGTDCIVNRPLLADITAMSRTYGPDDELLADHTFSVLHAAMVAEENKKGTKLGKRIKRLGVHQVLIDGIAPGVAAHFSRNKSWRDIDAECEKRGF